MFFSSPTNSKRKGSGWFHWIFFVLFVVGLLGIFLIPSDPLWEACYTSLSIAGCLTWLKASSS